ncbi:MAG: chloride channel protein [gamma proteobacterium symbiont of Ctena orbiculata]|uniref:Chloride channel protein n=1 Tax=Candidatus Thiodiazotropha taylori TaxID=2792791 RepID=A0A944MBR1_9GAMM|nr:chloride channel protein [Candidatus Thiodiazotropha taylori]PUB85548.1 MAG: chloride channel protein [gamma proteobacterium symbiont of Ctena orbiculata]MBT3029339.1 chloride channel protein [Candidatus Thiodiazotropha taylori]MBT3037184.1 chloride channel protein [Candidatus Thiodiazotropha taylori]MBV2135283.1 chloride channel protein [Candidatus Thiodiazotropha taylori]
MPTVPFAGIVNWFDRLRLQLSRHDALLILSVLGLICGFVTGVVIILFRLLVESTQSTLLPGGGAENYEALHPLMRFLLPIAGGLLLGFVFLRYANGLHVLGIPRVMERLIYHQGHISVRGFLLQFFGAAIAIISGHSVGREGPHVFLGAASGSLLGQYLSLPNNSIRTLLGCGTAAAISASFDTPLAGVIFALEVVMMEYTLVSFIPIMLAAVSANSLSLIMFNGERVFDIAINQLGSLHELIFILLLGLAAGTASAAYVSLIQFISDRTQNMAFWLRNASAGVLIGLIALAVPQIMGIGYDTVNQILLGELGLYLLITLVVVKILATAISIGLGIPGGTIGPALFIGAALGGVIAPLPGLLFEGQVSDPGVYALIGMGAVMGAALQAPLAALTAIIELTHNPEIIMPGMLAIVIASLVNSELFGKSSMFHTLLEATGLNYHTDPVMQSLRRIGAASFMNRNLVQVNPLLSRDSARMILDQNPEWVLIKGEKDEMALMPAVDLLRILEQQEGDEEFDLLSLPATRLELAPLRMQATLQEALEKLDNSQADALYIEWYDEDHYWRIQGILTRPLIESAYHF